jgi:pilus assembly protein CpaE
MTTSVQALVAVDDEVDRGLIDTVVAGGAQVTVLDYVEVGGSTGSSYGAGDVLIVACADYTSDIQTYVTEATRQYPNRPIVLVCPASSNGYLRDAFSNGVDDVVAIPHDTGPDAERELTRQLVFALQKAVVRKRGAEPEKPVGDGALICVLGLKGGSGKTLTTINLGVSLAAAGHSVALVDLDLQFGDLALAMGLPPERTIYDLVRSGGSLDTEKLRDFLVEHPSGARALLAPLRPDHAALVTAPFIRELLRLLREMHEYVVIDTPPNFTPEVISAVDMSSDVLLVAMRDTLSLKNTKLGLETLERMEYDRRKIRVLLNRANTKVGIDRQDILGILGRDVDVLVPSHRDVTRSINQGTPIALERGVPAGKAFRELAKLYIDDRRGPETTGRRAPKAVPARTQDGASPTTASAGGRRRLFSRGKQ